MMWAPVGLHQISSFKLYLDAKCFIRQREMITASDNDVSSVIYSSIPEMKAAQNHR
jgi:hypothetical protein